LYALSDGFHIYNNIAPIDELFIPVSGLTNMDSIVIKTRFNEDTDKLILYLNDMNNPLVTYTCIDKSIISNVLNIHYGGIIGTEPLKVGLTLTKYEGESLDRGVPSWLDTASGYITMAATITVWNIDPKYLDPFWNFILIKTQLFAFFLCMFLAVRG
jgi:hypothetical protein